MNQMPADKKKVVVSDEEMKVLIKFYDKNRDGRLSLEEIRSLVDDYNHDKIQDPEVKRIIMKFDANDDRQIDEVEVKVFEETVTHRVRYAGYTAAAARAFRYLAFTSGARDASNCEVKMI